jgi:tetratricopeptide (TPR) repeat protein
MKSAISLLSGVCLVSLMLLGWGCTQGQQAVVQETKEIIKTYPYFEPDPVPILTRPSLWGKGARLYPYTYIDEYSQEAVDKEWTVVRMENPYIQVSVLPEVGGKIWGAVEKSTGREFIYTNHVLKFREVALRGPWTSGGIEFNFGIVGHTPSGAHPVDYLVQQNQNGSVSCVVGNMDLPSRTRWAVTVTVPRDKAYFETQSFWFNASPLHQSYYAWINGAIHVSDDLEYVFPGNSYIAHDFSVPLRPWPRDEHGRNLAWYKNNDFGSYKSYFTVGEYEDFFGGYWHDSDFGFGHWARYDDIPGQKIWIWGLSRQGMIWEDLLTDEDGQYSEPQAGRYFNQNDHALFAPQGADRWRQVWFPYKDIGPLVKASPYAVLNARFKNDQFEIGICPLQSLDDELTVYRADQEIFREHLSLSPLETYLHALSINGGKDKLVVKLGNKLIYHTDPGVNDLERPIRFQQYHEKSLSQMFLKTERMFQERNYFQALESYNKLLEQEPQHVAALARVAELHIRRGEDQIALEYAGRALEISMYDPLANYVYAQAARRLGKRTGAKEALGWAARSLEYRSSAYSQMAELYMLEDAPQLALDYSHRAVNYNAYNLNAYQVAAVAHRILGDLESAREVLAHIQTVDPLNHFSRFEDYMLSPTPQALASFQSMIRNEYPHETYLELALYYHSLGQNAEAVQLLQLAPEYPMVYYWLAFLHRDISPSESQRYLEKAGSLSALLVFPFREESIAPLQWAVAQQNQAWKAKYYLGLLFWSKGRIDEAKTLLAACGQPDFGPFYQVRAYIFREEAPERALLDYQKGVALDENNWRSLYCLLEFIRQTGLDQEALTQARAAAQRFPDSIPIRMEFVRALLSQKLYQEAADLLDNTQVLPSEGATAIHGLFETAHIQLALQYIHKNNLRRALKHLERSQEYPESFGSGRPYEPDLRLQEYLRALCHEQLGEKEEAAALFQAIYTYTMENWGRDAPHAYFGGLVLLRRGERQKAGQLMHEVPPARTVMQAIQKLED